MDTIQYKMHNLTVHCHITSDGDGIIEKQGTISSDPADEIIEILKKEQDDRNENEVNILIAYFENFEIMTEDTGHSTFRAFIKRVKYKYVANNHYVYKAGDDALCFYFILKGNVEASIAEQVDIDLNQTFGKKEMFKSSRRETSVQSKGVHLAYWTKHTYDLYIRPMKELNNKKEELLHDIDGRQLSENDLIEKASMFLDDAIRGREFKMHRNGNGPNIMNKILNHKYFQYCLVLITLSWLGLMWFEPPSTYVDNNAATTTYQYIIPHLIFEWLVFVVFLIECLLRFYVYSFGSKWFFSIRLQTLRVLLLVIFFADLLTASICIGDSFRFSRILRPFFLMLFMRDLRKQYFIIISCIPYIIQLIFLYLVMIALFARIGYHMFTYTANVYQRDAFLNGTGVYQEYLNGNNVSETLLYESVWTSFGTFFLSSLSLFVLFTTENFHDIFWPAWLENHTVIHWSYFLIYILVSTFFLMNFFIVLVYDAYRRVINKLDILDEQRKATALKVAWICLDPLERGYIDYMKFEKLIKMLKPTYTQFEMQVLFRLMDPNQTNKIFFEEFTAMMIKSLYFSIVKRSRADELKLYLQKVAKKLGPYGFEIVSMFTSKRYEWFVIIVTFSDVIALLTYHHYPTASNYLDFMLIIIITVFIVIEIIFKHQFMISRYFETTSNKIYFVITIIQLSGSIIGICDMEPRFVSGLRFFGICRILIVATFLRDILSKRFSFFRSLATNTLIQTIISMVPVFLRLCFYLCVGFVYIFTIIGMELFYNWHDADKWGKDRCDASKQLESDPYALFCDAGATLRTLFQMFITNKWHIVMYQAVETTNSWFVGIYFVLFFILGPILIANYILAIFLNTFFNSLEQEHQDEVSVELTEEDAEKETKQRMQEKLKKNIFQKQRDLIEEQKKLIKSLKEADPATKRKRILEIIEPILMKRKNAAEKHRNNIDYIASRALHKFSKDDVSDIIKSWILNDIKHIEKSKTFLLIFLEQSLSGEKLIELADHLSVVLEKAILPYMTQSSFDKTIKYLQSEIDQHPEKIKFRTAQDIGELIVDYLFDAVCQNIIDNNINGELIDNKNNDFISWMELFTGWEKSEIKQINAILLRHKTKTSKKIEEEIHNEIQNKFDEKVATFVVENIKNEELDLSSLQLKIKNGQRMDKEQEIFTNIADKLDKEKQEADNLIFIQDIYKIVAQSLTNKREWICFNCGNFNFPITTKATKYDNTFFCRLCGIAPLTSTIYALEGTETFAKGSMTSTTANIVTNEEEKIAEERGELEINDTTIDIRCPHSGKETACPAILRLSEKIEIYQDWINFVRTKYKGKNDIEFTTEPKIEDLDNETFNKAFIAASKLTKNVDQEKILQIKHLIQENIININQFSTLGRKQIINLMKNNAKLSGLICSKVYNNTKKLLITEAYSQQFRGFFTEFEADQVIEDYHHILHKHIDKGNKIASRSVFIYFQERLDCDYDECCSLSRHGQRRYQLNQENDKNDGHIDGDDEERKEKNVKIDEDAYIWSRKQFYAQSTLDLIHSYLVHHDWKSDEYMEDEEEIKYNRLKTINDKNECENDNINRQTNLEMTELTKNRRRHHTSNVLNEINKEKYVTNTDDNNIDPMSEYGFGIDHDYIHLKAKCKCLREEMLYNKLYTLRISRFDDLLIKATKHKKFAINNHSLKCTHYDVDYNIIRNSPIGIRHLLCIIIYTDCSKFCTEFRSTYRAITHKETEDEVTHRHRELYWYSRFLFEAIEFFGKSMSKKMRVYHGLNKVMQFQRFTSYFNQPVSTTIELFAAQNFSQGTGIIMEFERGSSDNPALIPRYLDVSWLSIFPNENERLFYGKNVVFQIRDIIEAETMTHHRKDLKALNLYQKLITNQQIDWTDTKQVKIETIEHLVSLIKKQKHKNKQYSIYIDGMHDINEEYEYKQDDMNQDYGEQLFQFFSINTPWVGIKNIHSIRSRLSDALLTDQSVNKVKYSISFIGLTVLFPNSTKIILTDLDSKIFSKKCENYIMCVIKYIEYINMNKNIVNNICEIILESSAEIESKPNPTLKKLSVIYSKLFKTLNWSIEYQFKLAIYHSLSFKRKSSTKNQTLNIRSIIDETINAYDDEGYTDFMDDKKRIRNSNSSNMLKEHSTPNVYNNILKENSTTKQRNDRFIQFLYIRNSFDTKIDDEEEEEEQESHELTITQQEQSINVDHDLAEKMMDIIGGQDTTEDGRNDLMVE